MLQPILKTKPIYSLFIFIQLFSNSFLVAQSINTESYQYLSPVPNAEMVLPSTVILIRDKSAFDASTIENRSNFIVTGEKSGLHKGTLSLLENNHILSFKPFLPFDYGERVTVELENRFKLIDGTYAPHLIYSFRITNTKVDVLLNPSIILKSDLANDEVNKKFFVKNAKLIQDSLPDDFPEYSVNYSNPSNGYIFFSPFVWLPEYAGYLIISDNYGIPVFYRKMSSKLFDFKKQPDGNLTYIESANNQFFIMNKKYEVIDSVKMQNGYSTDIHELRILENGHYLLFAYNSQHIGMDTVVTGGDPNAVVIGLVLQELDENKNVIFQWRSWDHFQITDATYDISLTDSLIDYVHANAIETDYDGNILLSCRHMDEVTKINRITGDIIWRWGGKYCKNNQFTFLNDSTGFSHQHCIRRLPNGNYMLFDNGNLHNPQFSRAVEYQMDETNRIVTMVWQYIDDPVTYSSAMGSVERLSNHNTFIGWGTTPKISEVAPDGTEVLSINFGKDSLGNDFIGYRAFKYDWDTNLLTTNLSTLEFGVVPIGQDKSLSFSLTNNFSETVEINSTYNRNTAFNLEQQLPIVLPSQATVDLSVIFNPDTEGAYIDDLHLRWETEGQRIAKVIHLTGYTDSTYLSVQDGQNPTDFKLSQNYPNPFNPVSKIIYTIPNRSQVKLQVFDILGNKIATLVDMEQSTGSYEVEFNGSNLASGIYFYRLSAGEFTSVKKMLLLK